MVPDTKSQVNILIHGVNHTGDCFKPLKALLEAHGGIWVAPTLADLAPRFKDFDDSASAVHHWFPNINVVVAHSMGSGTASRLVAAGWAKAIVCIAPLGPATAAGPGMLTRLTRPLGWGGAISLMREGAMPLSNPNLPNLFYAAGTPPEVVAERLSRLRPDPFDARWNMLFDIIPSRPRPHVPALTIRYADDALIPSAMVDRVWRWLGGDYATIPGPHNSFEDEQGAAETAQLIGDWMQRKGLLPHPTDIYHIAGTAALAYRI